MRDEKIYPILGIVLSLLIIGAHLFFSSTQYYPTMTDGLLVFLAIAAALISFFVYMRSKSSGEGPVRSFLFLSIGAGLWAIAEVIWAVYELWLRIPSPPLSLADLFWLLGYPFLIISLLVASAKARNRPSVSLAAFMVLSALAILVVRDSVVSSSQPFLVNFVNAAYVIGDIVLISLSIPLILSSLSSPVGLTWLVFGLAFVLIAVGDVAFFKLASVGAYGVVISTQIFYHLGYLWLAIGALLFEPSEKQ